MNSKPPNSPSLHCALLCCLPLAPLRKKAKGGKATGLARPVPDALGRSSAPDSPLPAAVCLPPAVCSPIPTRTSRLTRSATPSRSRSSNPPPSRRAATLPRERDFSHSSAVTGVGGTPSFLNPLLAANSSSKLTGTGAAASQSSLNTVLTALVVAVLPSGFW